MNAVWIDEDATAHQEKLRQHGITAPYFSNRDWAHAGGITAERLEWVADQGFVPGIYSVVGQWPGSWYPDFNPKQTAAFLSNELKRIGWKRNVPVCLDIESHDVAWCLAFFKEWRARRPTRVTYWTFEGFQGGLFTPADIAELRTRGLWYVPQLYKGDMTAQPQCPVLDLVAVGFPAGRIVGFYDAAALPYKWTGFAFTQARLP